MSSSSGGFFLTAEETAAALAEGKARGLPDGWNVTLDKRKRRKWIAPNGRSCDSIPKALTMSVEMGLLPADTVIPHPAPKKRGRPPKKKPPPPPILKPTLDLTKQEGEDEILDDDDDDDDDDDIDEDDDDDDDVFVQHRQRANSSNSTGRLKNDNNNTNHGGEDDHDDDEDEMEPPTNAETSLDVNGSHLTTVHWDPNSPAGQKIGRRIRIADDKQADWKEGRIIRYDPCTHKHKIQFTGNARSVDKVDSKNCAWIHLRMEDGVQIATRLVWAHVKGYAWWPAMVMETDIHKPREGFASVEFFGSLEVATLRDAPDCLRPFSRGKVDPVISKNKKKRNSSAIALAVEEERLIQQIRNEASMHYARCAWAMTQSMHGGGHWLGKRVQIFRSDINYPYGDTLSGRVRQYSPTHKKWLVNYELSEKSRKKYDSSWLNLQDKSLKVRVLEKPPKSTDELTELDLIPFIVGFQKVPPHGEGQDGTTDEGDDDDDDPMEGTDAYLAKAMKERCKGCTDYWRKGDAKVTCSVCNGSTHLGCANPPLTPEAHAKIMKSNEPYVCSKCTSCRGCYQMDICCGSHTQSVPPTLSFPDGDSLNLCTMCVRAYEKGQYCPNCAHSWNDEHFQQVQRQIRWQQVHRPKKRGRKRKLAPDEVPPDLPSFTIPAAVSNEDPIPKHAKVNPTWYFPETAQWGYTEVDMLTCDSCKLWVHAGCAHVTEEEYYETSSGDHPIYSKEFLCRACCRKRCLDMICKLQEEDSMLLFAEPVSEKVAPNYLDIIKQPMDLQTMLVRSEREEYDNHAWVREMFELMVLNALNFNRYHTTFWNEAKRFHQVCMETVFKTMGKAAPSSKYYASILDNYAKADQAKELEEARVQQDNTTEKKDLVAGAKVASIELPDLLDKPPDQASCITFKEVKLKSADAYFNAWMDCCFTCGSTGASDTMLFCVDCGEAFHSFCVNAPIHSMDAASASGWRCPNCKICEISGETPQDELKMLFCEMCDRAFSLDLLEPPLASAPPGLWVCGQCVDCHKCKNKLDPKGASLTYWSRDPHLCFRCGGCDGLVDQYKKGRKCPVCSTYWRDGDTDLAQCVDCDTKVHARCDSRASSYLRKVGGGEAGNDKYRCPSCSKKSGLNKNDGKITRGHMHEHAWKIVSQGMLLPGDSMSKEELQEKLMIQIDWKTRNLWRDEYRKVVLEGVRFLTRAREQFGDPRYLMDRFWAENVDIPAWMGHRATRFIHVAKKLRLDTLGFSARRIESCVLISKLAASWLKVACLTMGLKLKKNVKGSERVMKLLVAPHQSGSVDLCFDSIRCERNRNIINKDEWLEKFEPKLKPIIQGAILGNVQRSEEKVEEAAPLKDEGKYELAEPLCGWNHLLDKGDQAEHRWSDARECCLCHMCGDNDAGLPDETPARTTNANEPAIARVGRLLPMGDGNWVHASCALWSSETWEAERGGLVHAMEKARSRGSQLRCFGCGRPGATVGCSKANCSYNYHFPCAFASGAAFTPSKQTFCSTHKDSTDEAVSNPSFELMKTLIIAPEKNKPEKEKEVADTGEGALCPRIGTIVVHSLGEIETEHDGFHSQNYITPPGYLSTRVFWSTIKPRTRIVYMLKVEKLPSGRPSFVITPGDNPGASIKAATAEQAYRTLVDRVNICNAEHFSHGDLFSRLPTPRRSSKKTFGLNAPQFFGFGLNHVRKALEALPKTEAVVAPLTEGSSQYRFCYAQPSVEAIMDLQRKRAAVDAEKKLENSSGCARTEGMTAVTRSGGSDRITRALVRNAENETGASENGGSKTKQDSEKAKADRSRMQQKYREMKGVPMEQRLVAKRSHIHGWGLFSMIDIPKDGMVVEYMGEIVRQCVADKREKQYEISGEGSCYMFRLDLQRIVDATMIGCMARFMNHCCQSNAYAKVISVDTEMGPDKKIMVFANRDIKAGEEITYDYKFPVEDGSLRCTCGAPNCIGRMN